MNINLQEKKARALKIIKVLQQKTVGMPQPASNQIVEQCGKDPFLILISCLLSLRAKDTATLPVSLNLFKRAQTPQQILQIPIEELEKILYSIGFYRQKARQLHSVSHELLERFNGQVPESEEELLSLKGVGRKTANLVRGVAFDIPSICVDIHVHRISNRLGLVKTNTPEQTEVELKKILPQNYWVEYNRLMVIWGQNVCVPVSPLCSKCPIRPLCERVGVTKSR